MSDPYMARRTHDRAVIAAEMRAVPPPRAVICIPRRGKDPDYDRIWSIVGRYYYAGSGYPVFVADSPGDPFNVPAARNVAARMAGDWDVAAFVNADCVVPIESLRRGFAHAMRSGRVTIPFDHYFAMSAPGHRAGRDAKIPVGDRTLERLWRQSSYRRRYPQPFYAPAGEVIIPRAFWDRLGGWDERFVGYQPEDAAMLVSAGTFDRLAGPAYHFWHPKPRGVYVAANGAWPEYRDRLIALRERGEFRQNLVDEGRTIDHFGKWWWP